jgi:TP53 regulating kinase-like protein
MSPPETTHLPPRLFDPSSLTLITQGAEALVYRTAFLTSTTQCAVKYRPSKSYRHPTLDARLTRHRILAEARVLLRCLREGVRVPAVLAMDWEAGWLAMEWIEGKTIRACLDGYLKSMETESLEPQQDGAGEVWSLMGRVGKLVGKMHSVGIVHGDLTTSNLMLQRPEDTADESLEGDVVLIDFGLGVQSAQEEDRAVDLYVLERAFGSTHPQAEGLFKEVLRVYGESFKAAKGVLRRLEDVRQRGRKKSMVG